MCKLLLTPVIAIILTSCSASETPHFRGKYIVNSQGKVRAATENDVKTNKQGFTILHEEKTNFEPWKWKKSKEKSEALPSDSITWKYPANFDF